MYGFHLRRFRTIGLAIACITGFAMLLPAAGISGQSLLPEGFPIEDTYRPGYGETVGQVQLAKGQVVIIHSRMDSGFRAADNVPLFTDDTLVTLKKGYVRFQLNDGSVMTLASGTRLTIDRSVYSPEKKTRSSFMGMTMGKARFKVTKLLDFKRSEFKVKTQTAVCGVRGSDFIVIAGNAGTQVTALDHTQLEVMSLSTPEQPPTVLADFQQVSVEAGQPPSDIMTIDPEQVGRITQEFTGLSQDESPDAGGALPQQAPTGAGIRTGSGPLNGQQISGVNVSREDQFPAGELGVGSIPAELLTGIVIPESELVAPDQGMIPETPDLSALPEVISSVDISQQIDDAIEQVQEVYEIRQETLIDELQQAPEILPSLPGTPE